MAKEFGWAYVVGSQASGPKGSIQLAGDETRLDHDPNLLWSDDLNALLVSGNIIAHNFEIQNQTKTVFEFEVSGSSIFGDTPDDLHQFTGSIDVSGNITAHSFFGYGGDLEGVAINTYTNAGDNRLVTSVGAKSVHAEDNLLFDGNLLSVTGNIQAIEIQSQQVSSSIGLFEMLQSLDLQAERFTDGTITIETGTIANVDHFSANTLEGLLTTPSQTNITDVGTLNTLNVANDATFNGTFYVKTAENKIGVNVSDPRATEEILSTSTQLRLSSQREIFGVQDAQYTDLSTSTSGEFSIRPTSGFVGINKTDPTVALDVLGDAIISGNLTVSGTLKAETTDFVVSADTLTFGDESSDLIIINAQTIQAPNNLEINNTLFVSGSTVGVGDYSSGSKFDITSDGNQLSVGTSSEKLRVNVVSGSTTISTTSNSLNISSQTNILNELVVGSNGDIVLDNAGAMSSSISVSSDYGYFNNLETDNITNGNVIIDSTSITAPLLSGSSIAGTITTPAQTNITDVGTLNSLTVSGNATLGLDVITIDSLNKKVGVSKSNPQKKVEIKDTDVQLRLTNTDAIFGISNYTYADLKANSVGDLEITPSSGKVIIPSLNLTNVQQGTSNNFLSLDQNGNVILAPAVQSGIEVRNRVVVTQDYSVLNNDYFVGIQATQNLTITLPDASTLFNGQIMVLKDELENADIYQIQIAAAPNQYIENRTSITLSSPGSAINIYTDGQSRFFIM